MKSQMERIKHSDEAVLTFGLQQAMSASPGQAQVFLTNFFANKTVGVLTNVPGPTELLDSPELRFGRSWASRPARATSPLPRRSSATTTP